MKPIEILTLGMGAIGSLYSSRLQSNLTRLHCLTRHETHYIRKNGITIKNPDNSTTIFNPDFTYDKIDAVKIIPDYIIISTKVLPSINLVDDIGKVISKKTTLVLIQNGINIEDSYTKAFSQNEIISALAFVCVAKVKTGMVHHQDYGRLIIGNYPSGESVKAKNLESLFNQHVKCCKVSNNIIQDRYKKLLWNASFNPLSVIHNGKNTKELLHHQEILDVIKKVMQEVKLVANNVGCKITNNDIEKNISDTYKMTPYKTSMCLDWEQGKPIEKEAILENLIKVANEKNINIPTINSIYSQLCEKINNV